MIGYDELVSALTLWRERSGMTVGAADYLGTPPTPEPVSFAAYENRPGDPAVSGSEGKSGSEGEFAEINLDDDLNSDVFAEPIAEFAEGGETFSEVENPVEQPDYTEPFPTGVPKAPEDIGAAEYDLEASAGASADSLLDDVLIEASAAEPAEIAVDEAAILDQVPADPADATEPLDAPTADLAAHSADEAESADGDDDAAFISSAPYTDATADAVAAHDASDAVVVDGSLSAAVSDGTAAVAYPPVGLEEATVASDPSDPTLDQDAFAAEVEAARAELEVPPQADPASLAKATDALYAPIGEDDD